MVEEVVEVGQVEVVAEVPLPGEVVATAEVLRKVGAVVADNKPHLIQIK